MSEKIKARFKVMRKKNEINPDGMVSAGDFVGFVRGLDKAGSILVLNTVEFESTEKYFVIDVILNSENFDFSKRQAESYGVKVEEIDRWEAKKEK